jgi:Putative prokaryotic signal transducing protein
MKDIRAYATRTEADLDRLALEAAGIHAVVVGVGMAMEGGIQGVRLLVPDELVERALEVLERRQS